MYTYNKPDNLVELIETSVARYGERPLFGTPDTLGNDTWVTYDVVGKRIDALLAGLVSIGINKGDTVGVIAKNRVEWAIADHLKQKFKGYEIPRSYIWKRNPLALKMVC